MPDLVIRMQNYAIALDKPSCMSDLDVVRTPAGTSHHSSLQLQNHWAEDAEIVIRGARETHFEDLTDSLDQEAKLVDSFA